MSDKPIKTRPQLYAVYFGGLQEVARNMGYNLLIHGSMNRDMDLVAVPWIDEPKSHLELLNGFCDFLGAVKFAEATMYNHTKQAAGRDSYVINLNRGKHHNGWFCSDSDEQYYLDISITPLVTHSQI